MNKKLIAIAIASAMAAPVAMADMKISARVAQDFTIFSDDDVADDARGLSDSGHGRIQFDGTVGNAYVRIARDARLEKDLGADKRDQYVGYKFGGGMSLQAGRMANAGKNAEKDPYIATFLESRTTAANSNTATKYGSNGFVDNIFQLSMKAGGAKVKVQYGASENADDHNGYIGLGVTGKAGGVGWHASYNNGSADGNSLAPPYASQSNIKVGANMKFGKTKVGLMYTSMDKDGAPAANNATDSIMLSGDFGLGNGMSANVAYATKSGDVAADDTTWLRLAVLKKLSKGVAVYAGYVATDNDGSDGDTSEVGVGMTVKF